MATRIDPLADRRDRDVPSSSEVSVGRAGPLPADAARGSRRRARWSVVTSALVIFGTIFVASASEGQSAADGGTAFSITIHDIAYLILGVFAFYLAARTRLERLVRARPLLMGVGILLLLAVKAVGVEANGGKRWLNLHVINLQPSEIFKLCTVVFIAWLVLHHHDELNDWKQLVVRTLPIWLGCGLIVLEPDLGTASVVLVIAVAMLAVAGTLAQTARRFAALLSVLPWAPTSSPTRTRRGASFRSCTPTPISPPVAISCCSRALASGRAA